MGQILIEKLGSEISALEQTIADNPKMKLTGTILEKVSLLSSALYYQNEIAAQDAAATPPAVETPAETPAV